MPFVILFFLLLCPSLCAAEPEAWQVHNAALSHSGIDMRDAAGWKKKVKASAALPRLQFDFSRRVRADVDVNVNDNVYVGSESVVIGPEEGRYAESVDTSNVVGVKAVWSLAELIFNRDSLSASRESLNVMKERNALLEIVNKHYFERRKILADIVRVEAEKVPKALIKKKEAELSNLRLELEKETAALDALTGGWFTRELSKSD